MHVLYLSPDGMTDPLGQSQVIPYLNGLAQRGIKLILVSLEKPLLYKQYSDGVSTALHSNIEWYPISYSKKIPFLSQWINVLRLLWKAYQLKHKRKVDLVHARSYLGAWVAWWIYKIWKTPFLFDMRGFWADERLEGKIWRMANPLQAGLYIYFKKKEKQFLRYAFHTVSLTHSAKDWLVKYYDVSASSVSVIPCCVDTQHFCLLRSEYTEKAGKPLRLIYAGSLGTWYMLDEMLLFYQQLQRVEPAAEFWIITREPADWVIQACKCLGVSYENILVQAATRDEMPYLFSQADVGLFFIRPTFSKMASSATKMAEMLACGLPIITNKGIGDHDYLFQRYDCGILLNSIEASDIRSLDPESLLANVIGYVWRSPQFYRQIALQYFNLQDGVDAYATIYENLMKKLH